MSSKNHHYIPQFYLRRFASNPKASKSKKEIQIFEKEHLAWREKTTRIKEIASVTDFHTIGTNTDIETVIARWETQFHAISDEVLQKNSLIVGKLSQLAYFIAFQFFRTQRTRNSLQKRLMIALTNPEIISKEEQNMWRARIIGHLVEERLTLAQILVQQSSAKKTALQIFQIQMNTLYDKYKDLERSVQDGKLSPQVISYFLENESFTKQFHLKQFYGFAHRLVPKFVRMNWLLLTHPSLDTSFITSDHPTIIIHNATALVKKEVTLEVILSLITGRIDFDVNGFDEANALVLFPLAPRHLIMIAGRNVVSGDGVIVAENSFSSEEVRRINNMLQLIYAERQIYAGGKVELPLEVLTYLQALKSFSLKSDLM